MASNYPSPPASPRRLDDLLICPVCLEGFKEPRTLTCLHTFCTNCLEHCRRAYRRDISCPVCKKVTHLPALGVQGLQSDFRVQQIKDILINHGPEQGGEGKEADPNNKVCDLCKTQQKQSPACFHCIQCFMYFCSPCHIKHNNNPLFSCHHVINMGESNATEVLFCRVHSDHPVRYFCKPCSIMLCTICTMNHEPGHAPEPLEKGIITKYRRELEGSLRTIKSKLSEVKTKTKYLETVKETHQRALYKAQIAIKEKTDAIVHRIREQENRLLHEVQNKIDAQMKETGIESLGEIKFYRSSIETLYTEIQSVIQGSPQQCLVAYEDLIARLNSIPDTPPISSSPSSRENNIVKFVPAMDNLEIVIGTLQECSLQDDCDEVEQSTAVDSLGNKAVSPKLRKRTASILSALSPGRKNEVKMGKIKGYSSAHEMSAGSPRGKINADDVLRSDSELNRDRSPSRPVAQALNFMKTSSSPDPVQNQGASSPVSFGNNSHNSPVSGSTPSSPAPTIHQISTRTTTAVDTTVNNPTGISSGNNSVVPTNTPISAKFRLVFKVDQVGQWPGKITVPSGIAFLPDGNLIVAECENRLQVFDRNGHSVRVIGWGKVQPQRVTAMPDGKIAVTDKKDKCIKMYSPEGDLVGSWGAGMFEMPTGIAVNSVGNFIITDTDRHMVSIHRPDGSLIKQFGSWGTGDYQFNTPTNVTVDKDDIIYVADSSNNCIKVYDDKAVLVRKLTMSANNKQSQARRPLGLTVANNGNVIVVDRDNHRVTMYNSEGKFLQHLLCKSDGLKYPCDVKLSHDNHIALVETHSGFLTKDPHHCIKLFHIF